MHKMAFVSGYQRKWKASSVKWTVLQCVFCVALLRLHSVNGKSCSELDPVRSPVLASTLEYPSDYPSNTVILNVRWQYPEIINVCKNLTVKEFHVSYRTDDMAEIRLVTYENSTDIKGLLPYTEYYVRIRYEIDDLQSDFSEEESHVTHEAAPGPVENLQSSSEVDTITLTWEKPIKTNGIILSYKIEYRRLTINNCSPNPEQEEYDTGLVSGSLTYFHIDIPPKYARTQYEYRVWGETSGGNGTQSKRDGTQWSLSRVPSGQVRNFHADIDTVKDDEYAIQFSWEPPECSDQRGTFRHYEYEFVDYSENTHLVETVTSTEVTFTYAHGVRPSSTYSLKVAFVNDAGRGPFTDPLRAKTPDYGPDAGIIVVCILSGLIGIILISSLVFFCWKYKRYENKPPRELII